MLRVTFVVLIVATILLESVQLLALALTGYEPDKCTASENASPIVKAKCVLQGITTRYDILPPLWALFVASGALLQPASVLRHIRPTLLTVRHDGEDSPLPFLVVRLAGLSAAMVTVTSLVMYAPSQTMGSSIGLNVAWGCTGVLSGCAMVMRPESRPYGVYATLTGATVAGRNIFRLLQSTCVDPSNMYSQMVVSLTDDIDQVASVAESTVTAVTMVGQDQGARRTLGNVRDMLMSDEGIQKMQNVVSTAEGVMIGATEYTDRALMYEQHMNGYTNTIGSHVDKMSTDVRGATSHERALLAQYDEAVETVADKSQDLQKIAAAQNVPVNTDVTKFVPGAIAKATAYEDTLRDAETKLALGNTLKATAYEDTLRDAKTKLVPGAIAKAAAYEDTLRDAESAVFVPDGIASVNKQLEETVNTITSKDTRESITHGTTQLHDVVDKSKEPFVPTIVEAGESTSSILAQVESVTDNARSRIDMIPDADGDIPPRPAGGDGGEPAVENNEGQSITVKEISRLPLSVAMIGSTILMNPETSRMLTILGDYAYTEHGLPQLRKKLEPTFDQLLETHDAVDAIGDAVGDSDFGTWVSSLGGW